MLTVQTSAGQVDLKKPSGSGNIYHVMIDKMYHGQITHTSQGWRCYLADKSEITFADIKLLVEAVEKAEKY